MSQFRFCEHRTTEMRWRNRTVGLIGVQCLECGDNTRRGWVPHIEARQQIDDLTTLADWAEIDASDKRPETVDLFPIENDYKADRRVEKAEYDEYLASDAWKRRRQKVIERANGMCEGCLTEPARDVHHRTYKHFKQEFAFELLALCRQCHTRVHARSQK